MNCSLLLHFSLNETLPVLPV